jgi:hypothetical protein
VTTAINAKVGAAASDSQAAARKATGLLMRSIITLPPATRALDPSLQVYVWQEEPAAGAAFTAGAGA